VSSQTHSWPAKAGHFLLHEMKLLVPPIIFFFCAFNLIALTANLQAERYWFALSTFFTATTLALIVGKAVLVANSIRVIHRFHNAPLIVPILYKTLIYSVIVMVFRMIEQLLHFVFADEGFATAFHHASAAFTWHRFAAIQIWLFICFLIYVTATELSAAMGPGELRRLLLHRR
jgi:hypothetical protein